MEPLPRPGPEGWLALAVTAAAGAGALAMVVTATRLPFAAGLLSGAAFYRALVGHVSFSLVVWLLSATVAVALQRSRCRLPGLFLTVAWMGVLFMAVGLLLPGHSVVVDYLPYVESPAYLLGYGVFAAGTAAALGWMAWTAPHHCLELRCLATAYAATLVALACGLARTALPSAAVWGAGHALQFVYVTALALAWYELAFPEVSRPPQPRLSGLAFGLGAGLSWAPALLYFFADPAHLPRWTGANAAMGFGLSVPTALHLAVLAPHLVHAAGVEGAALRWSVALYLLGGALAPFGAPNTLRVTAHYHAMLVGGVTTAFMGAAYRILHAAGRPVGEHHARLQVHLFGAGVVLTVAALMVAASQGMPRKAYLTGGHPWSAPVLLVGAAGLLTAVGAAWFLISAWRALWRPSTAGGEEAIRPGARQPHPSPSG